MYIANLRNYSRIELNEYQFETLKEISYGLNKKLIPHTCIIHLSFLIKRKCILRIVSH